MRLVFIFILMGFLVPRQDSMQKPVWPERYSASYGFDLMTDHNELIIISSIDSTCRAYRMGIRPGMEVIGWNTLPIQEKLQSMKVRKYRKIFPVMTDQNIRLVLLARGRPGETAEVFLLTETDNNKGIKVIAE
jgi:predicted metalloprotease with PDZ domain